MKKRPGTWIQGCICIYCIFFLNTQNVFYMFTQTPNPYSTENTYFNSIPVALLFLALSIISKRSSTIQTWFLLNNWIHWDIFFDTPAKIHLQSSFLSMLVPFCNQFTALLSYFGILSASFIMREHLLKCNLSSRALLHSLCVQLCQLFQWHLMWPLVAAL